MSQADIIKGLKAAQPTEEEFAEWLKVIELLRRKGKPGSWQWKAAGTLERIREDVYMSSWHYLEGRMEADEETNIEEYI